MNRRTTYRRTDATVLAQLIVIGSLFVASTGLSCLLVAMVTATAR